jgi:hypothetical protein
MDEPLRIGDVIHGHANGEFGRDYYGCSRVEFVASDWVVVRTLDDYGIPWFASGPGTVANLTNARMIDLAGEDGHSFGCPVSSRM